MDPLPKRPKVRTLLRFLHSLGWQPRRQNGSHEIWVAPSGRRSISLVVNHPGDDVTPQVLAHVLHALRLEDMAGGTAP